MELTYDQALNRAAALCSRGEKCAMEVVSKALDWGLSEEEAVRLVEQLRTDRFIDDARYVHAFVHDKYTYQHWGRVKIRYALLQKRLPLTLVDNTLDDIIGKEDYLEALIELLRVKMRNMMLPLSQNDRAKLYRFAAQRGYEAGVIGKALGQLDVCDE